MRPVVPISADQAIELYRTEKAKRLERDREQREHDDAVIDMAKQGLKVEAEGRRQGRKIA